VSSGFGDNVGVIAQHYKTVTRLFLCKHALVEDLGQKPHRAFKIDPQFDATKLKTVLGRTLSWPWLLVATLKNISFILVLNAEKSNHFIPEGTGNPLRSGS
jgi:hypothetical protein